MSLTLLRAYRSGGDVGAYGVGVAAAPGGFYLAEAGLISGALCLARIASTGSISWQLARDISALISSSPPLVLSNATHVALFLEDFSSSVYKTHVLLFTSAGSPVWQIQLPLCTLGHGFEPGRAAMDASNNLVISAMDAAGSDSMIMKITGSTGAIEWTVSTRHTSAGTGTDWTGPVAFLSGGDIVAAPRGSAHTGAQRTYVQRLSGTDGSVVWSRSVAYGATVSSSGLAVDPSDNIYLWGRSFNGVNGPQTPLMKFDSSGSTLWSGDVKSPTSQGANPYTLVTNGRGMANASGVFIPSDMGQAPSTSKIRRGYTYVPAGGSSGATLLYISATATDDPTGTVYSGGETGTELFFGYVQLLSNYDAILVAGSGSTADDGTYSGYTKASTAFDLAATTTTVATATYTRASVGSYTAGSPPTLPTLTGDILLSTILAGTTSYAATSLGVVTNFGTPSSMPRATSIGAVTNFGTPTLRPVAAALGPVAVFGTPAGSPQPVTCAATSLAPTIQFGNGWAYKDWTPDLPHWAVWGEPQTRFGSAAVTTTFAATATGASTTQFGAARSQRVQSATGFLAAQFGAASAAYMLSATGFRSLQSGTPVALRIGNASGFTTARCGTPRAVFTSTRQATGFLVTSFGSPAQYSAVRARSAYFRTHFGEAACERTAP